MPKITIANTYEPIIYALKEEFGGYVVQMGSNLKRHRQGYQWIITGYEMVGLFLESIVDELFIKRERGEKVLELISLHSKKSDMDESDWREKMGDLQSQIKEMNKRGVATKNS